MKTIAFAWRFLWSRPLAAALNLLLLTLGLGSVTFLLLVRPLVLWLQGASDVALKPMAARAGFEWAKADKRREFLRVRRDAQGGLELFANQSSGVLTSTVWGDGVVDNPPGQRIVHGDTVQFIAFSEWLA